jgi:hypothetical protein
VKNKWVKLWSSIVVLVLLSCAISGVVSTVNQSSSNLMQPSENDASTETATLMASMIGMMSSPSRSEILVR